jgi:hypothetical protein
LLEIEQKGPKQWKFINDEDEVKVFMMASSITNKFYLITEFIDRVSKYCGEDFDNWFIKFLKDCKDEENRSESIINNIDQLKKFVDNYLKFKNIDFSQFVDKSKAKKNTILFEPDEIEKIITLSSYLKIYSVISNSENLRPSQTLHREAYNKIAGDIIEEGIIKKIHEVIKTKTYRYNLTDKFMWEYIKNVQGKDIGTHILHIFNFIMNQILVMCEEDKNPITYFVGVIDESLKWFLRSVYRGAIVYEDSISTEDVQGINVDNLKTYSYNDTIGRLEMIALTKLYDKLEKESSVLMERKDSDELTVEFDKRVENIEFISPLTETLVYPILAQMTKIPYSHFRTVSPKGAAIISTYMQDLFRKVFDQEYKYLFSLLNFYPKKNPSISTTYRVKSIHEYIDVQQSTKNFYGFKTKILPHTLLCHYVGRISRVNFENILDGREIGGIPLSKIESDMIKFYTKYFAGEHKNEIKQMIRLMNSDF